MRSGNGRHRRPRQVPAIVVAAGVTGSAIAIPLLGAGSASAADATTWDRVAECESAGMWSADLDNGHYGGLQFSQETWQDFGGTEYAPRADLASRSQQIAVAEKVLDAQGPAAWPVCAPLAGLKNDGAATGVDPGLLPSSEQSDPAKSLIPAKPSTAAASAEPSADPAGSAESPATDAAPDADSSGGKHRGEPAPEKSEPENADIDREIGRHASRGDDSARDKAGESGEADAAPGEYTVRPGDSLWSIADKQEISGGWTDLYEVNQETVGADPDLIRPGQSLDLGTKQR
ncbi:transglycosylase family protein [Streptomyces maoxianensis]|uniref:Transglycosylase family protein n=1 Tax=Streptomyces maoxianensis TaxID=1459942 RepID=A0ABV9G8D5_9ACTN